MKMKIRVANPAGNITVFVMDKARREDYAKISAQILAKKELHAEQVGFLEQNGEAVHMQMMGGEFCGNATRSFAYLLSMLSDEKPEELLVDVSGSDRALKAEVNLERGTSRVEMPLPVDRKELRLEEKEVYPMVVFEGICHMIIERAPGEQEFVDRLIGEAEKICPCDAYGIMFLQKEKMVPVVYVKETNSMVWESSCGSGSMGVAVYLSEGEKDGNFVYRLEQPGGVIEASVCKKNGRVIFCQMGGAVAISEEMEIEINV